MACMRKCFLPRDPWMTFLFYTCTLRARRGYIFPIPPMTLTETITHQPHLHITLRTFRISPFHSSHSIQKALFPPSPSRLSSLFPRIPPLEDFLSMQYFSHIFFSLIDSQCSAIRCNIPNIYTPKKKNQPSIL